MKKQIVHCPNCGSLAERIYHSTSGVMKTQCLVCDYLMVICLQTGKVIESYAPGISVAKMKLQNSRWSQLDEYLIDGVTEL